MRLRRKLWLKLFCAGAIAVVALPVSAQVFLPLALVADDDKDEAQPQKADYWIGVRCAELPPLLQAQLDLPDGQGVLVDEVVDDSPAKRAGLKAYDVIFTVDGKPIADPQALAAAVGRAEDREVTIEYLRAGRKHSLSIKPAPRPDSLAPREQDERSIRQWIERLGNGPAPMNLRFFHPGRVLPPGASLFPPLPGDMTVTIQKEGDKAAQITAKQGDKKWEAGEDSLDKLPPEARQFAERMLGLGAFNLAEFDARRMPGEPGLPPNAWTLNRREPDARLDKRLDELNRQIEELRKSVEKLQK
jgi:membrane-associated protease RseP (regulator of RpoE activity)